MLKGIVALLALSVVVSCSPIFTFHGFVPTEEDLAEIEVGLDTRATVASIIGKPGASGLLEESGWYYVRSEFEHAPIRGPQEIDRQVVAISFDDDNVVSNVERFGQERGQVVVLSRRVTDSNIEGVNFLGQLFGSNASATNIARSSPISDPALVTGADGGARRRSARRAVGVSRPLHPPPGTRSPRR